MLTFLIALVVFNISWIEDSLKKAPFFSVFWIDSAFSHRHVNVVGHFEQKEKEENP